MTQCASVFSDLLRQVAKGAAHAVDAVVGHDGTLVKFDMNQLDSMKGQMMMALEASKAQVLHELDVDVDEINSEVDRIMVLDYTILGVAAAISVSSAVILLCLHRMRKNRIEDTSREAGYIEDYP